MGSEKGVRDSMQVKAIAPWAGAKRNLAPYIVKVIGPHNAYWEPFCGGLSVLLVKPPSRIEVVNDLNGDLINLARIIVDPILGMKLYRKLRRTLFCQELHRELQEQLKNESDPLGRAYCYFVKVWQSWGGVAGTTRDGYKMSIRYTNNGGHQAKRFASAVDSIPAWRRRLRQVTIQNEDAFKLLSLIQDAEGTVIYCDPPYIEKNLEYTHDFVLEDHWRLAESLNRFAKTKVILSYYDHPLLEELYPEWSMEKIEVTKALVNSQRRGRKRSQATEVLLCNQARNGQKALFQ